MANKKYTRSLKNPSMINHSCKHISRSLMIRCLKWTVSSLESCWPGLMFFLMTSNCKYGLISI